jgi:predicted phosphodiesterase
MLTQDRYQFSFAIIGDTHVKPESGDQSAPWKVNELATGRARWIAREISRYSPRFVIHLGDLVHPVPELPTFGQAVALTKQVFQSHHNSLHVIPGNHDIGDKPNRMMPAKSVRDDWIAIHETNFGPSWSSFNSGDIRFVLINNPILNSGSPMEKSQRLWLEEQFASAAGRRLFLFMHYPLFLFSPDEASTYDNIDEPARSDFIALIEKYRVEAVIAGHVHNIFYHRIRETEYYVMPATSFVRQDFSEMYRLAAAAENGRNDAEKLGFAIVDVYENGHVLHYLRSYGEGIAADTGAATPEKRSSYRVLPHPKKPGGAPLGVFLRHPWAETVTLPYNGPMDEFHRKQARNDYPSATLWRLGIRDVRIPLSDLIDETTRNRMSDLVAVGHRFTVFSFDLPKGPALALVESHRTLIHRFEIILPRDAILEKTAELDVFRRALGRPVLLSPVATSADEVKSGSKIELFVAHGFRPSETGAIDELIVRDPLAGLDRFVFRAHLSDNLPEMVEALAVWSRSSGRDVECFLRVASSNPAQNITDDAGILSGIVEFFALALAHPEISFMIDTFMDVDRGYFVRHGLIDRRCNLRPAGLAVEALTAHLCIDDDGPWSFAMHAVPQGRVITLLSAKRTAVIALPATSAMTVPQDLLDSVLGPAKLTQTIPLDRPWTIDPAIGTATSRPGLPQQFSGPTLVIGTASS